MILSSKDLVLILRKTSLTLDDIRKLSPEQAFEIAGELYYQDAMDNWRLNKLVAELLAAIYNAPHVKLNRGKKPSDYFNAREPTRDNRPNLEAKAESRGLFYPSKIFKEAK